MIDRNDNSDRLKHLCESCVDNMTLGEFRGEKLVDRRYPKKTLNWLTMKFSKSQWIYVIFLIISVSIGRSTGKLPAILNAGHTY